MLISENLNVLSIYGQDYDSKIDNQKYWKEVVDRGLISLNPDVTPPVAIRRSSIISSANVLNANYPDILIISGATSQSENSIFVDTNNSNVVLNSNNSTNRPPVRATDILGANASRSTNRGKTWAGSIQGVGVANGGDPATVISANGRWFVGYITATKGQGISFSDNQGSTWNNVNVATCQGCSPTSDTSLDKNHLWVDNSSSSRYRGNLYSAWTPIGTTSANDLEIESLRLLAGRLIKIEKQLKIKKANTNK